MFIWSGKCKIFIYSWNCPKKYNSLQIPYCLFYKCFTVKFILIKHLKYSSRWKSVQVKKANAIKQTRLNYWWEVYLSYLYVKDQLLFMNCSNSLQRKAILFRMLSFSKFLINLLLLLYSLFRLTIKIFILIFIWY